MAGQSKAPIAFKKVNMVVGLEMASIYAVDQIRNVDRPHLKERGGKETIKKQGGYFKPNGRRIGATVVKDKSEVALSCSVAVPGKKRKKRIILGDRDTYGEVLKAMVEKAEAESIKRNKDKAPKVYTKLKRKPRSKPKGRR